MDNPESGDQDPTARAKVRGTEQEVIPENEKSTVKAWIGRIEKRRGSQAYKNYLNHIKKWRRYLSGNVGTEELTGSASEVDNDTGASLVRANLIYATLSNAVPRTYAKNPEIDVDPSESVEPARYEVVEKFCKTLSIILNNQFSDRNAGLKSHVKRTLRAAQAVAIGWVKVLYQKDMDEDPVIINRMKDIQENINVIDATIEEIDQQEDPLSEDELSEQREFLRNQLLALAEKAEVVRQEGLIIDTPASEDITLSANIREICQYRRCHWMSERIFMDEDDMKANFGFIPKKATKYYNREDADKKTTGQQSTAQESNTENKECEYLIHEVWDARGNRVYTLCEGYEGYMRDPYSPDTGERWYPYFGLHFNDLDGILFPLSDVEMLIELQDEYNETRTNFREHRQNSIPFFFGLKSALSESDATKIQNPKPFDLILIDGEEGMTIDNYIKEFSPPRIDPKVYDTQHIRVDWELISGQGDASRGVVAKPKTLGEAEILERGQQSRSNERIDVIEDFVEEIANYAAQILLQEINQDQALKIAGPGATWPELTRDEIFDMVQISIRAGSTGKPDKVQEQERWLKFLPIIRETLQAMAEVKAAGGDERMIKAMMNILQETMERFDERMDVTKLLEVDSEDENENKGPDPAEMAKMQEAQKQAAQQAEMMDAQIRKLKADTIKVLSEAEANEMGQQFDMYMTMVERLRQMLPMEQQQPQLPGQQLQTLQ